MPIPSGLYEIAAITKKRNLNSEESIRINYTRELNSDYRNRNNGIFIDTPNDQNRTTKNKESEKNLRKVLKKSEDKCGLNLRSDSYPVNGSMNQNMARTNKRIRYEVAGSDSYPICQVDECRENLLNAKDYHRRHKVCEFHSKSPTAMVGKETQRFCQQCSRFHLLSKFDEGKRSCRDRLSGHNRRRRRIQTQEPSLMPNFPAGKNEYNDGVGNSNVFGLTILSQVSGFKDHSDQVLDEIESHFDIQSSVDLPIPRDLDLNIPVTLENGLQDDEQACKNPRHSSPLGFLFGEHKSQRNSLEQEEGLDLQNLPCEITKLSSRSLHPTEEYEDGIMLDLQDLRLQLSSSSSTNDSPIKFSSDHNNPIKFSMPSPVTRELFPLHFSKDKTCEMVSLYEEEERIYPEASISGRLNMPLELFKKSIDQEMMNVACPSCSDRSPSPSISSKIQTRRIVFNLFSAGPNNLPSALDTQMFNWLSNGPLDMESYIKPDPMILSIYASMPSILWEKMEKNFLPYVRSLIEEPTSNFWRNFNFIIHNDKEMAIYKDGTIHLSKSCPWIDPELISVSPLAVVGGESTELVLRCRNITSSAKIHCTNLGGDMSEVLSSSYSSMTCKLGTTSFTFIRDFPNGLGRCFLEVENGFRGNYFPLIIANSSSICHEIRTLECVFSEDEHHGLSMCPEKFSQREHVLHFLNELGWLFQRYNCSRKPVSADFSHDRFILLFTFSIEHDWPYLVKTLLDVYFSMNPSWMSTNGLSEIQLLNMAVKRKCRDMVDMLLNYHLSHESDGSVKYLFTPSQAGSGGATPLHLAACTENSEEVVDALTNDPQQIGLKCWNSLLDSFELTPYNCAYMRNNHAYNELVSRKLKDRYNAQVSITITSVEDSQNQSSTQQKVGNPNTQIQQNQSCPQCTDVLMRNDGKRKGSYGLIHKPYINSMLTIASVCVCVCLMFRASPVIGSVEPFKWAKVPYGII